MLLFLGQPQGSGVFTIMFILEMDDQRREGNKQAGVLKKLTKKDMPFWFCHGFLAHKSWLIT